MLDSMQSKKGNNKTVLKAGEVSQPVRGLQEYMSMDPSTLIFLGSQAVSNAHGTPVLLEGADKSKELILSGYQPNF